MKKMLALALSVIVTFSLLTGCGGDTSVKDNLQTGNQEVESIETGKTETSEDISQETESTPEVVSGTTDDYIDTTPRKFAESKAPNYYREAMEFWNSIVTDTREDVVVGDFAYRVYNLKGSNEKLAVCDSYVGPVDGVTDIVIPGEINGIPVFRIQISNTLPDSVTSVVVEEGVAMIESSFLKEPKLAHIELPDTLVHTFESFLDLPALTEIELPENIYWLAGFRRCENLTQVTIPASVGYIEAFGYCNLNSVTIEGDNVYCIDYNSFRDNPSLTEVKIPDSVRAIAAGCFMNTNIAEFDVPACLQEVGRPGDTNKTNLNERVLMNTPYMDSIEEDFLVWNDRYLIAYFGDEESVTIPDGITYLCNYVFDADSIKEIIVPEGVEVFSTYTIFNTPALTKLDLPSTLTHFDFSYDMKKLLYTTCVVYLPEGSIAAEEFDKKPHMVYVVK